ncbi:histidine phosphatase family protein [Nonomuraea sp. M3C6]|uniref:Histidine phosphatase family protein n=1 Tax=Nonomuraea marmarensis TaxID=3351344 RepID=A0ABW7ATD5_9ACTN
MRSSLALLACACLLTGCGSGPPQPSPATAPPTATASGTATAPATATATAGLVERLRQGGHVLYIRHTATDTTQDAPSPDLSDPGTQRNLSPAGREQARQIGQAIRRLRIPIGQVLASPYRRTRETAELAFGRAQEIRDLINEIYPGADDEELARALRRLLSRRPAAGTNTVLVSHGFNLSRATGLSTAEGDTVVFSPGTMEPVATIGADEWRSLKE